MQAKLSTNELLTLIRFISITRGNESRNIKNINHKSTIYSKTLSQHNGCSDVSIFRIYLKFLNSLGKNQLCTMYSSTKLTNSVPVLGTVVVLPRTTWCCVGKEPIFIPPPPDRRWNETSTRKRIGLQKRKTYQLGKLFPRIWNEKYHLFLNIFTTQLKSTFRNVSSESEYRNRSSFLNNLTFVHKFLSNYSTCLTPLLEPQSHAIENKTWIDFNLDYWNKFEWSKCSTPHTK